MPKRFAQIAVLLFTSVIMLGASSPSNRFDKLGHSLMCTCSCGEILLECNHVGCPTSGPMINELHAQLATNLGNHAILEWFAAKYGPIVLAAPIRGGFDLVAWIVPFAVLALGLLAILWLLRHWRDRHMQAATVAMASNAPNPHMAESHPLRERIRRETNFEP